MDGFKYGLMVFSDPGGTESAELAPGAWTFVSKLETFLDKEVIGHWRKQVGALEWEKLTKEQRMVLLRIRSATPEVLDGENYALQNRLFQLRRALLLAGPNALVAGKSWFMDGQAEGLSRTDRLSSIRTFGRATPIIRPYYCTRDSFWERKPRGYGEDGWLDRWRDAITLLDQAAEGTLPSLLFFGLLAFERASEVRDIEFKIPDCVRAAESVLGLPRSGGGQGTFANRVLALAPEVRNDWFVGGADVQDRLIRLYVHRNECVHGKAPFLSLQAEGVNGPEEAARFDYLAEFVARSALLSALRHPRAREIFASRETLEREWEEKRFP